MHINLCQQRAMRTILYPGVYNADSGNASTYISQISMSIRLTNSTPKALTSMLTTCTMRISAMHAMSNTHTLASNIYPRQHKCILSAHNNACILYKNAYFYIRSAYITYNPIFTAHAMHIRSSTTCTMCICRTYILIICITLAVKLKNQIHSITVRYSPYVIAKYTAPTFFPANRLSVLYFDRF